MKYRQSQKSRSTDERADSKSSVEAPQRTESKCSVAEAQEQHATDMAQDTMEIYTMEKDETPKYVQSGEQQEGNAAQKQELAASSERTAEQTTTYDIECTAAATEMTRLAKQMYTKLSLRSKP